MAFHRQNPIPLEGNLEGMSHLGDATERFVTSFLAMHSYELSPERRTILVQALRKAITETLLGNPETTTDENMIPRIKAKVRLLLANEQPDTIEQIVDLLRTFCSENGMLFMPDMPLENADVQQNIYEGNSHYLHDEAFIRSFTLEDETGSLKILYLFICPQNEEGLFAVDIQLQMPADGKKVSLLPFKAKDVRF
jgi:hypothetical protein